MDSTAKPGWGGGQERSEEMPKTSRPSLVSTFIWSPSSTSEVRSRPTNHLPGWRKSSQDCWLTLLRRSSVLFGHLLLDLLQEFLVGRGRLGAVLHQVLEERRLGWSVVPAGGQSRVGTGGRRIQSSTVRGEGASSSAGCRLPVGWGTKQTRLSTSEVGNPPADEL